MASTIERLRELYPAEQLMALDCVRGELLRNPEALDTHSKKRNGHGDEAEKA